VAMRRRLALFLYYTNYCRLIGLNPTKLCNWLMNSKIDGRRYDAFGGYRWTLPANHPDLYDH